MAQELQPGQGLPRSPQQSPPPQIHKSAQESASPSLEAGHFLGDLRLCIDRALLGATLASPSVPGLGPGWSGVKRGQPGPAVHSEGGRPPALCFHGVSSRGLAPVCVYVCRGWKAQREGHGSGGGGRSKDPLSWEMASLPASARRTPRLRFLCSKPTKHAPSWCCLLCQAEDDLPSVSLAPETRAVLGSLTTAP